MCRDSTPTEWTTRTNSDDLPRGPAKSGPWKTIDDLELATLGWVHWHNTQRLHGYLGDVPPLEHEEKFYAGVTSAKELVEIK